MTSTPAVLRISMFLIAAGLSASASACLVSTEQTHHPPASGDLGAVSPGGAGNGSAPGGGDVSKGGPKGPTGGSSDTGDDTSVPGVDTTTPNTGSGTNGGGIPGAAGLGSNGTGAGNTGGGVPFQPSVNTLPDGGVGAP